MKFPHPLLVVLTMLSAGVRAAEPQISVGWRIGEIMADAKVPKTEAGLRDNPKVDVVRPPAFSVASGKTGEASVTRDFGNGGKSPVPVGVFLSITPTRVGKRIQYSVDSKWTGYLGRNAAKKGVFQVATIKGMSGTCGKGEKVWLELGTRLDRQIVPDGDNGTKTIQIKRRLVAILTFDEA